MILIIVKDKYFCQPLCKLFSDFAMWAFFILKKRVNPYILSFSGFMVLFAGDRGAEFYLRIHKTVWGNCKSLTTIYKV